jgi:hypothetical protein
VSCYKIAAPAHFPPRNSKQKLQLGTSVYINLGDHTFALVLFSRNLTKSRSVAIKFFMDPVFPETVLKLPFCRGKSWVSEKNWRPRDCRAEPGGTPSRQFLVPFYFWHDVSITAFCRLRTVQAGSEVRVIIRKYEQLI